MILSLIALALLICHPTAFASSEKRPTWVDDANRHVQQGDLLHVGSGIGTTLAQARFLADAQAVRAMITECSLPHKDIVIWARWTEKLPDGRFRAYSQASLPLDLYEEGKRARGKERERLISKKLAQDQEDFDFVEQRMRPETLVSKIKAWFQEKFDQLIERADRTDEDVAELQKRINSLEARGVLPRSRPKSNGAVPLPPVESTPSGRASEIGRTWSGRCLDLTDTSFQVVAAAGVRRYELASRNQPCFTVFYGSTPTSGYSCREGEPRHVLLITKQTRFTGTGYVRELMIDYKERRVRPLWVDFEPRLVKVSMKNGFESTWQMYSESLECAEKCDRLAYEPAMRGRVSASLLEECGFSRP